jgi:hypothetical protein
MDSTFPIVDLHCTILRWAIRPCRFYHIMMCLEDHIREGKQPSQFTSSLVCSNRATVFMPKFGEERANDVDGWFLSVSEEHPSIS